jgi:hypothetical protein
MTVEHAPTLIQVEKDPRAPQLRMPSGHPWSCSRLPWAPAHRSSWSPYEQDPPHRNEPIFIGVGAGRCVGVPLRRRPH